MRTANYNLQLYTVQSTFNLHTKSKRTAWQGRFFSGLDFELERRVKKIAQGSSKKNL